MRKWSIYNQAQWEWVADRYNEGYPISEIAQALHVHRNTVVYHLKSKKIWDKRPPLSERMNEFYSRGEPIVKNAK